MGCGPSKASVKNTRKPARDQSANQASNQSIEASSVPAHKSSDGAAAPAVAASKPKFSPFYGMPQHLTDAIHSFLPTKDLIRSTATCRLFAANVASNESPAQVMRLLKHVVRGEQVEVEALLVKNPRLLLFNTGNTFDYSGRSIKGLSAWQAALCAGDVEMLAMMQPYFDAIKITTRKPNGDTTITKVISGEQIRLEQTQVVFPKGFDAHLAQQEASTYNFDALVAAIDGSNEAELQSAIDLKDAILPAATYASDEKTSESVACSLTTELNKFRQAFTTHSIQEKIFNPQHLLRALEIYNAQYDGWDYKKCRVFWSQVVGFAQRFMPACYAQAFAQGLYYLTKESNPEPLKRSLSFRHGGGKIFSDGSDFLGLGFEFAAGTPEGAWGWGVWILCVGGPRREFQKIMSNKNRLLCGLMPEPVQQIQPAPW